MICLGNHEADLLRLRLRLVTNGIGVDTFYELPSVWNNKNDKDCPKAIMIEIWTEMLKLDSYSEYS